jgi:transaldolase
VPAIGRLHLDSADLAEAADAARSGVVSGITTNPAIMAAATSAPLVRLGELLETFVSGPVFYQLTARDADEAAAEAAAVRSAAAGYVDRVVLKLPAQPWWYGIAAQFVDQGWPVAFTAVYEAGQAICAVETGASWIIPYVDRSSRLRPSESGVVGRLRPFVPDDVVLLAASLKSPAQAVEALHDGADAITTSWHVITGLMEHPLTDSAVEEFMKTLEEARREG